MTEQFAELVNLDGGIINRRIFIEPEVYAAQLKQVFARECTQTCRGVVSRWMPLNTQMGLGHDRFDPALGAWVSDYRFSKSNHRQFYRRWSALIATPDRDVCTGTNAREAEHA